MNLARHTLLLQLVFLLLSVVGFSQVNNYRQYTVEDGLPTNYVYGLVEDDRGYIWAYTEQGIARFDGYEWKAYDLNDGLATLDCYSMCPLDDGSFLVGGNGWPTIVKGDSLFRFPRPAGIEKEYLEKSFLREGYPPWIGFNYGDNNLERRNLLITSADSSKLYTVRPNIFFGGSDERIFASEEERVKVVNQIESKEQFFTSNSFFVGNVGEHKFAFWKSPFHYYVDGEVIGTPDSKSYRAFRGLVSNGRLQVYLDSVLFQYDSTFQRFEKPPLSLSSWYSLFDINRVFIAKNGDLWLATRSSGVLHVLSESQNFKILSEEGKRVVPIEGVTSTPYGLFVADDKSNLYKADNGGLQSLRVDGLVKDDSRYQSLRESGDGELLFLRGKRVLSVTENSVKVADIFLGHSVDSIKQRLLREYGWIGRKPEDYFTDFASRGYVICKDFVLLEDAVYFIRINADGSVFTLRSPTRFVYDKRSLKNESEVYLGNNFDLFRLSDTTFDTIWTSDTLSITALYSLNENNFLIGTQSNGVYRLSLGEETKLVHLFSSKRVKTISRDATGNYWAATFSGVFRFTEDGDVDLHLSKSNGLPSSETYDLDFFADSVALGTASGVVLFAKDLKVGVGNTIPGRFVHIDEIKVNGETFANNGLDLKLEPDENDLEIDFCLLHPGSDGEIAYEVQLYPYDREPIVQTSRSVRYPQLNAGSYSFTINATAADASVYTLEHPIDIRVRAYLYTQVWFQVLCLAIVGGLGWFLLRWREKEKFKVEAERLNSNRRISELQLEALRSQMNPHFVFNALGSIQYYIQSEEKDLADSYLTKFANLMRKYLDSSKRNLVTVGEEVALLTQYIELEKMRFDHAFTYQFCKDDEVDDSDPLPSMILQPFVENAIIHGLANRTTPGGKIMISILDDNGATVVIVADNGIGLENSNKLKRRGHRSRATEITNERIIALRNSGNAEIDLTYDVLDPNDQNCPGTKATLRINLHPDEN